MKIGLEITRKSVAKIIVVLVLMFLMFFFGFAGGLSLTYPKAYKDGYETALADIQGLLAQKDIQLEWEDLGNGLYQINIKQISTGQGITTFKFQLDCYIWHFDKYGNLMDYSHHPMTTVIGGREWVENTLFNSSYGDTHALYIACSNDSSTVQTSWTAIPNEIADGGLERDEGTYTSAGIGSANITKTFSVTATRSTKLYGLYYGPGLSATLVCAEQQGTQNQKNMNNGDSLQITIRWTLN